MSGEIILIKTIIIVAAFGFSFASHGAIIKELKKQEVCGTISELASPGGNLLNAIFVPEAEYSLAKNTYSFRYYASVSEYHEDTRYQLIKHAFFNQSRICFNDSKIRVMKQEN